MADPWFDGADPWGETPKTAPASFSPPPPTNGSHGFPSANAPEFCPQQNAGPTLAPKKSRWQDQTRNIYFITMEGGDQVLVEGDILPGKKCRGTLQNGTLNIPELPGMHQYSENKIMLGAPMNGVWTRLEDDAGAQNMAWQQNGAMLNGAAQNGTGAQPTDNWGGGYQQPQQWQQEYAEPQQDYSQQQDYTQQQDYSQTQNTGNDGWDYNSQQTSYGYQQPETQNASTAWGNYTATPEPAPNANQWSAWDGGNSNAATNDPWGAWGAGNNAAAKEESWEDQEQRRYANYWKDFKEAQDWYIQQGQPAGSNVTADPFQSCRETKGQGEDFFLYDSVQVTVQGTNADGDRMRSLESFKDLWSRYSTDVPATLMDNINKCGFTKPTPVQKYAIVCGLEGRDVMCCAQTGSGKTASFLIPMLASMIKHHKAIGDLGQPFEGPCKPDTLILTPTRELCVQTFEDALKFCYNTSHRCYRVYGQQSAKAQLGELAKGADLIVATVGRLYDFVRAKIINLEEVNCLVLDEADRMLDLGFKDQLEEIVEQHNMPRKEDSRQTMMFSATFPDQIQELARAYLHDYLLVIVGKQGSPAVTVTQVLKKVEKEKKYESLKEHIEEILQRDRDNRILVFTNSKNAAKFLDQQLYDCNIANTAAIHGDLDQPKREQHLDSFRNGTIDVMIATDVASRGLDISRVSHVINYDAPKEISLYVHRIGRTGRIGHRGTAITFITYEGGWLMDSDDFIRELPDVMEGAANTTVPDWLRELSDSKKSDVWDYKKYDWETKDIRDQTFEGWTNTEEIKSQNQWADWQQGDNGNNNNNGNDWSGSGWN